MLPMIPAPALRTRMVAGTLAFALALAPAAPSFAWGKKEQGFVAGVATVLLLNALARNDGFLRPAPTQTPAYVPVYAPATTSIYNSPVAATFNAYSDAEQRRIQSVLSAYGYYRGPIDGSFGPGTYNAVVAYANATKRSNLTTTMAGCATLYEDLLF